MPRTSNLRTAGAAPTFQASTGETAPGVTNTANLSSDTSFAAAVEIRAQEIADQLLKERAEALRRASSGRVFTKFDAVNDIVENQKQVVTAGVWSNGIGTLTSFYTSSTASNEQKRYYYEAYNSASEALTSEPQFSVAYGNRLGSGSDTSGQVNDSPTRAIYSQYRLLLLEPNDDIFTFANSNNSDSIYVVNFNRARIKEKLDPGNWQMNLAELSGSSVPNNVHTGSNVKVSGTGNIIKIIDDSGDTAEAFSTVGSSGRIYNAVSGTIEDGPHLDSGGNIVYYGLVYPDVGFIVLNAEMLDASASFNTVTGSDIPGNNAFKLFTAISGSPVIDSELGFSARNSETVTSTHYFVRVKNSEYNFSNNPSFVTGSVGEFKQPTFIGDPKVYVTTVGLFSERQELLAVAKLSRPVIKSFSSEVLIKVKLDF